VRLWRVLVAALVMVASDRRHARTRKHAVVSADPSAALNVRAPVPSPVMSTLRRACFDCHSDETRWPWYATLPLASHLIEREDAGDEVGHLPG
jgi:heme-binding protein